MKLQKYTRNVNKRKDPSSSVGINFLQPTFNKGSTSPLAHHPADSGRETLLEYGGNGSVQQ